MSHKRTKEDYYAYALLAMLAVAVIVLVSWGVSLFTPLDLWHVAVILTAILLLVLGIKNFKHYKSNRPIAPTVHTSNVSETSSTTAEVQAGANEKTASAATAPYEHQLDDTDEFPAVEAVDLQPQEQIVATHHKPKGARSTYIVDSTVKPPVLIVTHHRKVGPRGKKSWVVSTTNLEIKVDSLVHAHLLTRGAFEPTDSETKILCFTRLHWWSHMPQQISVAVFYVVGLIGIFFLPKTEFLTTNTLLGIAGAWTLFNAIFGLVIWLRWAFTYLVFTDKRILRIYRPPAPLPSHTDQAPYARLQGISDSQTTLGRMFGFGSIYSETAANTTDKWVQDGIDHVPEPQRAVAILAKYTNDK